MRTLNKRLPNFSFQRDHITRRHLLIDIESKRIKKIIISVQSVEKRRAKNIDELSF